MPANVIVWDLEKVPNLQGFNAAWSCHNNV